LVENEKNLAAAILENFFPGSDYSNAVNKIGGDVC